MRNRVLGKLISSAVAVCFVLGMCLVLTAGCQENTKAGVDTCKQGKACSPECQKACQGKACSPECQKTCPKAAQGKACPPDCKKPCCAKGAKEAPKAEPKAEAKPAPAPAGEKK
jgi:hypothetical protein